MKTIFAMMLLVACVAGQAQTQFINPDGLMKSSGYTHVVVAGNTVYISGQVPTNEKGEVVGRGDLRAQTVQVYENLKKCLASVGLTFSDVVKMNTYVVNFKPEELGVVREVRRGYLNAEAPPASTLAGVQALFHPDVRIEMEAIAIKK
ncbi:MAG: RidA family protein [Cyclobacteriaceae bacterium]|jgi:enamine deaminase RidA (YjgF/YER057c/UK114 family)|nr:RidA family protein [Cyclobacteriaceae bacterium]